ncbi:MAG: hypothetical protein QF724_02025 [Planctomycetota bacterium]|jgi:antitoxin component YwqK of YwqJK toxin-antitoxin module|nr:hypothetical protein [Planctomycetota bacterium]MDP6837691.1 hypothetical protein [Planctomycetota bacterium]
MYEESSKWGRSAWLAALLLLWACAACSTDTAYYAGRGTKRHSGQRSGELETGTWTYWYENGQVRERGEYADGQRTGQWTQWHKNGQLLSRGERLFDPDTGGSLREGPWVYWHENGSLRARGSFERGEEVGSWERWSEKGVPED